MIKTIDERIRRKLAGIRLAFRGVITLVNAAGGVQLVQGTGLNSETLQGMEYFQHFGFTSNPPAGTMYVTIPLGGKTVHCVIVGTENANIRLKGLQPGESALYNDQGMKVHLTETGIVIDGGGKPLTIQNCTDINVTATGKATVTASEVDVIGAVGGTKYQFVSTGCACPLGGNHMMGSQALKGTL